MARIGVFVGSVFGAAEEVAHEVSHSLSRAGHLVEIYLSPSLDDFLDYHQDVVLMITSTTGQGELPDNLLPLYQSLHDLAPLMPQLRFGIIALGDSSYGEARYCGAGRQIDAQLQQLQAIPLVPRLDVDACIHFDPLEVVMPWLQEWEKQAEAA